MILKNDVRDDGTNDADLYSLIVQFKTKSNYPVNFNADKFAVYSYITSPGYLKNPNHKRDLKLYLEMYPEAEDDKKIQQALKAKSPEEKEIATSSIKKISNIDTQNSSLHHVKDERG